MTVSTDSNAPAVAASPSVSDPRVTAAFDAWNAAFNRDDPNACAALYFADATMLPPTHTVAQGPEQIETFIAGAMAHLSDHSLAPLQIVDAGDTLVVASRWSATATDGSGNTSATGGLCIHTLQEDDDGSWMIMQHTFN